MTEREKNNERLEKIESAIAEIKETSKNNVEMFLEHEKQVVGQLAEIKTEIVSELGKLHNKIDKQKEEMDEITRANNKTFGAMLRNDINNAMNNLELTKDEDGNTHIDLSDYENLDALFDDYLNERKLNGAFKRIYENEFQKFVIDR